MKVVIYPQKLEAKRMYDSGDITASGIKRYNPYIPDNPEYTQFVSWSHLTTLCETVCA